MKTPSKTSSKEARIENVYQLEGRVPIAKAIPFGLQHVLAMFVANVAPLIIISSVAVYQGEAFTAIETARLLQNCMLIAGIGTLLQFYPIWKIGSGLPVVMGISFTFLAACLATASQDYGIMFGALAMILGGLFPPIGAFFTTLPDCVLGGCTVIMFGSIMMSCVRMMHDAGMDQRNTLIAATSICLGVGVTQVDGFFNELPSFIGDIFAGNMVAGVFVVGLILDLCLPRATTAA